MLAAIPLLWRLIALGVLLTGIAGGVTAWSVHQYNKGYAAAISAIAAKDREAVNAVNAGKLKVDECVSRNGEWDTISGVCRTK